jgi:hypothetical protein
MSGGRYAAGAPASFATLAPGVADPALPVTALRRACRSFAGWARGVPGTNKQGRLSPARRRPGLFARMAGPRLSRPHATAR